MKQKHRTLSHYIAEKMKEKPFKEAWGALDEEFLLLESLIKAREKSGITQAKLAQLIGTKQPALSRLERGGYRQATIATLQKIAHAMGSTLTIQLKPVSKSGLRTR